MAYILVCDDNPDILEMVEFILTAEGHSVTTVSNGRQVLQAIGGDAPDLVLLDLRMPGLGGLGVLRMLGGRSEKSPPVVVLSAKGRTEDRKAALDAGAMAYLVKPFSLGDLLDTVKRYLPSPTDV
jgi:two-component system response regulator MprA